MERAGREEDCVNAFAISRIAATPVALSTAPLNMESPSTGSPTPRWSQLDILKRYLSARAEHGLSNHILCVTDFLILFVTVRQVLKPKGTCLKSCSLALSRRSIDTPAASKSFLAASIEIQP